MYARCARVVSMRRALTLLVGIVSVAFLLLLVVSIYDSSSCWYGRGVAVSRTVYTNRHVTIGYTERDQLLRYLAKSDVIDSLPANRQRHDVILVSLVVMETPALAVLKLRDDVKVLLATKRVRGGNSYRTIYRAANHRQACAYVDNADDTYDVICRLVDTCADVSVHLTYVAFGAYTWDGAYINRLVWRGSVCVNMTTGSDSSLITGHHQDLRDHSNGGVTAAARAFTGWRRANKTQPLQWVKAEGEQQMSDADMASCLALTPAPIYLVGDSHLRLALTSLILHTDSTARAANFSLTKQRTNFTRGLYVYSFGGFLVNHTAYEGFLSDPRGLLPRYKELHNGTWRMTLGSGYTTVMDALARWKLDKMQRRLATSSSRNQTLRSTNHRRRLVVSFGTWDLDRVNIKYFVSRSLPAFRYFLESLRRDKVMSEVKVIVTTTPAVKEQTYAFSTLGGLHSVLRNNAMQAAANRLLADIVHAFDNVALADWFAMTVSRSLEARDDVHYVKIRRRPELNDVGLAMMRMLVEHVCS